MLCLQLDTNVFLFTDMLLITKAVKKGSDQLLIYKPVSNLLANMMCEYTLTAI